jgi:hypothetical protein
MFKFKINNGPKKLLKIIKYFIFPHSSFSYAQVPQKSYKN